MVVRILALILLPTALMAETIQPNPLIDYAAFLKVAAEAAAFRENRRISEQRFIELSREPDTIVLDSRSQSKFEKLHIMGAKNLVFSDITESALQKVVPSKDTKILIYCNNNFLNSPAAFPTKAPAAALNIPTFVTLYSYGYRNIFELAPLVDPSRSKLEFEGEKDQMSDPSN